MALKKLSTYRKKRDFGKTAEPSGDVRVAPAKQRRFVIQKHDATRLHYDLRLEFDGVFKSWAVTRGPSLDPHDKRLAVEVEDHPLDYGDFEGTIPKGQYGGGTVMLWDRGTWESDDPERGFKKGDLKFTLHGDKLHGSWVLVRMKRRPLRRQAHQLAPDQAPRRICARMARPTTSSRRIAPSPPAGRWSRSRRARARRQSRSCWPRARRRPMRSGNPTAAMRPTRAPAGKRQRYAPRRRPESQAPAQSAQAEEGLGDAGFRRAAALRAPSSGRRTRTAGATRSSSTAIACSCGSRMARSR